MLTLLNKLKFTLQKDKRLVSDDGELLKNKIIELALKFDKDLIHSLMKEKDLKEHFFTEVDKIIVFDQLKFMKFVDNKEFLPDSYTTFKNKVGLTVEDSYLSQNKEVVLSWPYKDCILEGGMEKEDEKRDEVFFNEILAPDEIDRLKEPKVFSNFKRIDAKGEYKVTEIKPTDNLIIKGNNLLALYSLKKKFAGRVKSIYIDIPYNTGSDSFLYNDRFNHSTWLTFMKNRLEVAKELLRNDGLIFVQCDDNEQGYLKVLLDEIFNRENYQSTFYVQVRYPAKQLATAMKFHKSIETIFVYGKTDKPLIHQRLEEVDFTKYIWEIKEGKPFKTINLKGYKVEIFNSNNHKIIEHKQNRNNLLKEIWASGKILDSSSTGRFFRDYLNGRFKEDGYGVLYKVYGIGEGSSGYRYITGPKKEGATKGKYYQEIPLSKLKEDYKGELQAISNYLDMAANFGNCRHEGGVELRSGKKPEILLKHILEISTKEGDLILDYHLGCGTTCAVAHKMKRQYIGIEQLDYDENDSVVRLKNVIGKENGKGKLHPVIEDYDTTGISETVNWKGGGDFVYCELMKWNDKYIDEIKKAKTSKELIKIWNFMKEKAFLSYKVDVGEFDKDCKEFEKLSIENQKRFLIECLDKNQLYVNLSEIDDSDYRVSKEDKDLNKKFYGAL